jgi:hypothetical protein
MDFLDVFSKNPQTPHVMKIRLVGAEVFLADGQTDRKNDEGSSLNFANAPENSLMWLLGRKKQTVRKCAVVMSD